MKISPKFDDVLQTPAYPNIGNEIPPRYAYNYNQKISLNPQIDFCSNGIGRRTLCVEKDLRSSHEEFDLPSVKDLTHVFQKCKNMKCSACADHAFFLVCSSGLDAYGLLGNHLVPMFVECGSLSKAQEVFLRLIYRDEYSWNSLIKGYIDSGNCQHGLDLYKSMQEDCVDATSFTFVPLLKVCAQLRLLDVGQEFHTMIVEEEHEKDPFIANSLIYMYAKCGMFVEAQDIFYQLIDRDVVSWNSLIAGYSDPFLVSAENSIFHQMLLDGATPNAITYACSLKACGDVNIVEGGREIHIHATKTGLEGDVYVGNTLVDVYCKWGFLEEARKVFNDLPYQNTVSWNALMAGYVENDNYEEALSCFDEMHADGVVRDTFTFVSALKACSNTGNMIASLKMHSIVIKEGHEKDAFVSNALANMYAKQGLFEESLLAFVKLRTSDAVPWNALVSGYIDNGLHQEALECLEEMQMRDVPHDVATFVCSLNTCGNLGYIEMGLELHTWISKLKLETDILISNALLAMYVEWGLLSEAKKLFEVLPVRDIISWNTVIAGFAEHCQSERAISTFNEMEQEGMVPDTFSYVSCLKACGNLCAIDKGQEIHIAIIKKAAENDVIGISLLEMYAKCGSVTQAQETFDLLDTRDCAAWTALMNGYIENGLFEEVAYFIEEMQSRGVSPNAWIFGLSLKACGCLGSVRRIWQLYADAAKQGLENDSSVLHSLLASLGKCGLGSEAVWLFKKLSVHDVLTWNALLSACSDRGFDEELLAIDDKMKRQGISPNAKTFVYVLKGCAHARRIDDGQEVHDELVKVGIEKDPFIATNLVDMYAKCGFVSESQNVFDQLLIQDEVSWNFLTAGYIDNGLYDHAQIRLDKMQEHFPSFDAITYVSWLRTCVHEKDIKNAREIHGEIIKKGFENEALVTSALPATYVKCGSFVEAQYVVDRLSMRCNSPWNALICGYAEHGLHEKVLDCLERMQAEGLPQSEGSYVCSLKACSDSGGIELGQKLHTGIVKRGFDAITRVSNALLDMHAKCGLFDEAWSVLEGLPRRDAVSWNAMIAGYAKRGLYGEALGCLRCMQSDEVLPNAVTHVCTLDLCARLGSLADARHIHLGVCKAGLDKGLILGTALVDMYAKFGRLDEAESVFDSISGRDTVSWNALTAGYSEHGLESHASGCLERMEMEGVPPNPQSWNAAILGLIGRGKAQKGFFFYAQMQERGVLPDSAIFTSLLKACGEAAALESGRRIHSQIGKLGLDDVESTALVAMYAKCGSMSGAKRAFDAAPSRDLSTWTALMMGYARHAESGIVADLWKRMIDEGIRPNAVTFLGAISLCSHTGLVDRARMWFDAMQTGYGILPSSKHLNCAIDLLCRLGHVEEAFVMAENMHCRADTVTRTILLAACQNRACPEHRKHIHGLQAEELYIDI